jgi:hypothetical protein
MSNPLHLDDQIGSMELGNFQSEAAGNQFTKDYAPLDNVSDNFIQRYRIDLQEIPADEKSLQQLLIRSSPQFSELELQDPSNDGMFGSAALFLATSTSSDCRHSRGKRSWTF